MPREDKIELTEAFVKSLQPNPAKDTYYNDDKLDGLVLIIRKGGRKVYALRTYDKNKKQIKRTIGNADQISLKAARTAAKIWCSQLVQGQDPFIESNRSDKNKTFEAVYDAWLKWSQSHQQDPKSSYIRKGPSECRGALSYFDKMQIDQINNKTIEDYRATRPELENSTINRYMVEVKFLMRWAKAHGIIDTHHAAEIKKFPETNSVRKTHHFSDEEREKLLMTVRDASQKKYWSHNMAYLWPLTLLLLHTGMRPGSALGLIWDDVDLRSGEIRLRAANIKTRKDARIYISPDMVQVLTEWKRQTTGRPEDPLFPGNGSQLKSVKKQYKRLFEKAGLDKKYSTYSLRHDCASELLAAGANLTDVQMALVHTDPRTTLKYAHPSADRMRQVAALLDKKRKESE